MNLARTVEAAGWDGLAVVDSQNLSGDPYVTLAMAATVTERIGLATAVTNSVTRHAAANATAIASVQRVAEGRAVLGIGRGDSALAHLGRAPGKVGHFETYLRHLQAYLRGDAVPFEVWPDGSGLPSCRAMKLIFPRTLRQRYLSCVFMMRPETAASAGC